MPLTREELAERCVATSFDKLVMDYNNKKVIYTHSFRDAEGAVLEDFLTEVHFSVLQPRLLTPPEERALLAFGLCHCTYVFLTAAKRAPLLQIRAGYFSPEELKFFRPALAGALAEYYYLADLDLADFRLECCCIPPQPKSESSLAPPAAAAAQATHAPATASPRQTGAASGAEPATSPGLAASALPAEAAPSPTPAPTAEVASNEAPSAASQPPVADAAAPAESASSVSDAAGRAEDKPGPPPSSAATIAAPASKPQTEQATSPPPSPGTAASSTAAPAEPGPGLAASFPADATPATPLAFEAVDPPPPQRPENHRPPRVLVPFGGGKDSTLLMELLSTMGAQVGWVYYGEWVGSWEVYTKFTRLAEASPAGTVVLAEQNLPCLDRLNELNLVPGLAFPDYTAYVSFYTFASAFVALQQNYDYMCVGNEYSANAINTTHPKYNYPVNHQYEKSFEAECAFHAYLRDYINPRLYYFSGLQHMTELEIAQRFAAICAAKYLDLIISCNYAMDDDWCGGCEKCAFVFLLFAAFLPVPDIMAKVFGVTPGALDRTTATTTDTSSPVVPGSRESLRGVYDMYDSERHVPVFESLMGLSGHKPFECVGTPEEVLAAMYLTVQNYRANIAGGSTQPPRMKASGADGTDVATAKADTNVAAAPEPAAAKCSGGQQEEHQKEKQQEEDGEGRLPLLLRKHLGLITSKGREEWDKIRESIRAVTETGQANVPTLYPDWFKQGVKEMGKHMRKD